jgi:hypothetical protein
MYAYDSEDKFAAAGPAATAVLQHRATHPEIKDGPWDFDRGTASKDGRSSAWGEFSHVALASGFGRDVLSIVVVEDGSGGWTVTHTITRSGKA